TTPQMASVAVPLYICPSRRGVTKNAVTRNGVTFPAVLTDYASAQPATKTRSDNTDQPVDVKTMYPTWTSWTNLSPYILTGDDTGAQTAVPDAQSQGRPPGDHGVYDGVIVRSAWYATTKNPFTNAWDGKFRDAPSPVRFKQITDGAAKTMMVGEKYI